MTQVPALGTVPWEEEICCFSDDVGWGRCDLVGRAMASGPITSRQIEGGKVEALTDFISLDSKSTAEGDCSHEIKRSLLVGRKV